MVSLPWEAAGWGCSAWGWLVISGVDVQCQGGRGMDCRSHRPAILDLAVREEVAWQRSAAWQARPSPSLWSGITPIPIGPIFRETEDCQFAPHSQSDLVVGSDMVATQQP